jgi:hypothetical protein
MWFFKNKKEKIKNKKIKKAFLERLFFVDIDFIKSRSRSAFVNPKKFAVTRLLKNRKQVCRKPANFS